MSAKKSDILHLRLSGSVRLPLKAIAVHHHRSQTNAVEWLVTEEYSRLIKSGEISPVTQERTPE